MLKIFSRNQKLFTSVGKPVLRHVPKAHTPVVFDHRAEFIAFRYFLNRHDGA